MSGRNLFTIPPGSPFLRGLARGLLERRSDPQGDFGKTLILLPTRRACRALCDTFLEFNDGAPVLLPRMQPLSDVDQDELDLHLAGLYGVDGLPDIPPAISPLKRLMLLSQLVQRYDESLNHEQALKLSAALATLIDQVHTENLDFGRLEKLVPQDLATHWKMTLDFLSIISEHWPQILMREGEIDPADRRNRLLKTLTAAWSAKEPLFPVIAAGSTGSIPTTAALLDTISRFRRGCVILPGLDRELDEESWDSFGPTHPQATMRSLLQRFETDRRMVKLWPGPEAAAPGRVRLARELMRPATTISAWTAMEEDGTSQLKSGLDGLDLIEARSLSDEAQAIAVILREVLESPGRTAALITPDRELARRVSSALRKWDVLVDDSAGAPLLSQPAGRFLSFILECVLTGFAPLNLLNLLKHPRCKITEDKGTLSDFETAICRGPRPRAGIDGLRRRIPEHKAELGVFIASLEEAFSPLTTLAKGTHSISDFVAALVCVAETLSRDKDRAWGGDDGEAASQLLSGLIEQSAHMPPPQADIFAAVLTHLMRGIIIRPRRDSHPRLVILGQLEARLIERDVMILGGLNEGSWPADAGHDPWMSRPMRGEFGLPAPERSTGLSAHDFAQALCAQRVVLTRSLKVDGSPTVPSRWLQRLGTLLKAAGLALEPNLVYPAWAQALQISAAPPEPAPRPEPRPPLEARPQGLYATDIERWMKNPYQIYVRRILRLKLLDPIDKDTTAAERGSLIHTVLERFVREYGTGPLPQNAKERLLEIARAEIAEKDGDAAHWQIWWPRVERIAGWFVAQEDSWRQQATPWLLEATGSYPIPTERGQFILSAKADRIDRLHAGGAAIIDYKTGQPPSLAAIKRGLSAQLPLEGLILREGGFGEKIEPKILAHWQTSGAARAGDVKAHDTGPAGEDNLITQAETGLKNLIAAYEQPDSPYVAHPPAGRTYDEDKAVAHLARVMEWAAQDDGEEEDA